jgi:hypothetical protein
MDQGWITVVKMEPPVAGEGHVEVFFIETKFGLKEF